MRAYVFTDSALARQAGRFVWLELDVERAENAAFRTRYPIAALPTYLVVDPREERVLLRWVGGATAAQLNGLLDGAHEQFAERTPSPEPKTADDYLALAERASGAGDEAAAAESYEKALAAASPEWPHYGRAVESLLLVHALAGESEACARLAAAELPRLAGAPSALNVSATGLDCALALADSVPERRQWIDQLEAGTLAAVEDTTNGASADDRSSALAVLVSARQAAGDSVGAVRVARRWSDFLDAAASTARTPEERAVFDSHRLSAYLELGEPERAIPMLQQSERDFPTDYNPPARLALAYREMGRYEDAMKASKRALGHAYGPRRLRVLETQASIQERMGDTPGARATLEEAVAYAEALPEGQRSEARTQALRRRLEAVP